MKTAAIGCFFDTAAFSGNKETNCLILHGDADDINPYTDAQTFLTQNLFRVPSVSQAGTEYENRIENGDFSNGTENWDIYVMQTVLFCSGKFFFEGLYLPKTDGDGVAISFHIFCKRCTRFFCRFRWSIDFFRLL